MKVIRKYHFFPLILFLSLFVDGQISFLISRFSPSSFEPTSFLFLYGFMLLSLYFSEIASIWWGVFFGFCFDVYFLHTLGIAFLVFPLLQVIFYRCNQIILVNRLTRFLTFLLTILIFQISTNLLLIIFISIKFLKFFKTIYYIIIYNFFVRINYNIWNIIISTLTF